MVKPSILLPLLHPSLFPSHVLRPQWPQNGQNIDADRFRGQFSGLIDLINQAGGITAVVVDSVNTLPPGSPANMNGSVNGTTLHFSFDIPQGQEGPMGQQGPPFANAVVDAVNTVNPGGPAAVSMSFDGSYVRLTFDIPRGNDGVNGINGSDGSQGPPGINGTYGAQGPPGPPFAQAVVDGVTTLNPGGNATMGVNFDGANVRFLLGIPQGQPGNDGAPGPPGEITAAQLKNAILGTSAPTNAVSTLGQAADNSYNQPQMQDILNKMDELINALRR